MNYAHLAGKVLRFNYRQYRSLFLVCAVGACLMLCAIAITDGMMRSVTQKARQYYGGDVQLIGGYSHSLLDSESLIEKMRAAVPKQVRFYSRFDCEATRSEIFYEGESIRQRIFKGVDFSAEADLFSHFTMVEGSAVASKAHNTMLLSKPLAEKLAVRAGDEVTLMMRTLDGYTNTMSLVVAGIFQDSSLFGMYTSYIDIHALRKAAGYPANYINRICLYYPEESPSQKDITALHAHLQQYFSLFPLSGSKADFYKAMDKADAPSPFYALISLDANINDLQILLDAIQTVLVFIVVILLVIIAVGIGSSYRVIAMKRITEIGTYRALGMTPNGVQALFITETVGLLAAGFLAGIIGMGIITTVLAQFNFSFIPAFDIFLIKGHLVSVYLVPKLLGVLCIIAVTTLLSVLFTIRNIVHISPVGALATTA